MYYMLKTLLLCYTIQHQWIYLHSILPNVCICTWKVWLSLFPLAMHALAVESGSPHCNGHTWNCCLLLELPGPTCKHVYTRCSLCRVVILLILCNGHYWAQVSSDCSFLITTSSFGCRCPCLKLPRLSCRHPWSGVENLPPILPSSPEQARRFYMSDSIGCLGSISSFPCGNADSLISSRIHRVPRTQALQSAIFVFTVSLLLI